MHLKAMFVNCIQNLSARAMV